MEFRPATAEDLEAIRSIARESWETDYPDIVSRETVDEGFDQWYDPGALARELREGDATILLAIEDEEPVGFAHAVVSEDVGNVLRLYVRPAVRGRGIGSDLLERTAERLADQGAGYLRAMVLEANEAGRSFYEAAGFAVVSDAETTIGADTETELTLERAVTAPAGSP